MILHYKDELLQSFLDNYSRIYLIDLEEDSIVKISETDDAPDEDPVHFGALASAKGVISAAFSFSHIRSTLSRNLLGSG